MRSRRNRWSAAWPAATSSTGQRKSTVYEITPQGRQALRTWLDEPGGGAGPVLELKALEDAPAAFERGEPSFAEAAQAA
ncbi:hypothetical protein [Actinomadura vinacea]|uniref:hypothetical protein n=1 Tax=Actinomadura vinacea TaxID=115336 RepID=UPI0031E31387